MPRPLLEVTRAEVKLFDRDKELMITHYGQGWTGVIRELVKIHCNMIRTKGSRGRLIVGDYDDE
jgi:hypothetical protein